ncbi:hypothetical protein C8J56DRAFT_932962 [Mycena floridula]|nr:hypothetical protein C8J56DRAFT_932962 [Mycena floridula]
MKYSTSVALITLALGVYFVDAAPEGEKPSKMDRCIAGACKIGKAAGHVAATVTKDVYNAVKEDPQLAFQAANAVNNRNQHSVKGAPNVATKPAAGKPPGSKPARRTRRGFIEIRDMSGNGLDELD